MKGAGRIDLGSRWGSPTRRHAPPGQRPHLSTPRARLAVSPVKDMPRPLRLIESLGFGGELAHLVSAAGRSIDADDWMDLCRSLRKETVPRVVARARSISKGMVHDFAGRVFVSALDSHLTLLGLEAYLLEAHAEASDDPLGAVASASKLAHAEDLMRENLLLVSLMTAFADHPEVGFPHPADLVGLIVEERFVSFVFGPSRTATRLGTLSAPIGSAQRFAARRWAERGPFPELLVQPDLRDFMIALGWNGRDLRASAALTHPGDLQP